MMDRTHKEVESLTALAALSQMSLADFVQVIAGALGRASAPKYADALNNPLGSERAFLDAGRAGRFPTFRRSRRVTALWSDVEAWSESRAIHRPVSTSEPSSDEELLERAGVVVPFKGRAGARR